MTTTDLTRTDVPTQFVNPTTGEVIDISDAEQMTLAASQAPEMLGLMLDVIDENIRRAQDVRAHIGQYLIDRMDADATQTLHAGEFTLTVNGGSDEYETYDADALRAGLMRLVETGAISEAAVAKAVRVKYEASKSGLNSLRALRDEAIDAAIDAARQVAVRRRRVTIKRTR